MANKSGVHDVEDDLIGVAAGRIRRFCEAISQGHEFGIEPGSHDEPWSLEFQREAVQIYPLTLPWNYLSDLAAAFEDCADLMITTPPPAADVVSEWAIVQQYLRSTAKVIGESTPTTIETTELKTASDIDPVTPPVMPFGRLAALMSAKGATDLAAIAGAVEHACGQRDTNPLTEAERDWLRRMRNGDRTIDIAVDHGYSERGLYRALADLYGRLGTDNRTEAVAIAIENNWIC